MWLILVSKSSFKFLFIFSIFQNNIFHLEFAMPILGAIYTREYRSGPVHTAILTQAGKEKLSFPTGTDFPF